MFNFIYDIFGTVFKFFYDLLGSYAGALLLFTFATKLLLLPLAIKQQKNTLKQVRLKPQEALIRAHYAYDPRLMNQKLQEFYQKNNFNPMGGCLPLLIQFPLIIILYNIIQHPLQYVSGLSTDDILTIAQELGTYGDMALDTIKTTIKSTDIAVAKSVIEAGGYQLGELFIEPLNFNLWFIDLSQAPSLSAITPVVIIPILSAATAFLTTFVSRMSQKYTAANEEAAKNPTMKIMTFSGPIISLLISFSLPGGIGFYWMLGNVFTALQSYLLNIFMSPKKEIEKAEAELKARVDARRAKKERQAAERSERIEREQLERKNAARKAAGLKPLLSLDSKEVDTSADEENIEETEKEENSHD